MMKSSGIRDQLSTQADLIEAVLAEHGVSARVAGGVVTPRWIRYNALLEFGTRLSKIRSLSEELARALSTGGCRVARRGAGVAIEIPRTDPQPIRLLPLLDQLSGEGTFPAFTATLGVEESGTPLLARLPSPDVAHMLIAGDGSAGKTTLMRSLALGLAMTNRAPVPGANGKQKTLGLVLIDTQGDAFGAFNELPHLTRGAVGDVGEAREALRSLVLLSRAVAGRTDSETPAMQRIVVLIDNLDALICTGGEVVRDALSQLLKTGRKAGVHLVVAVERPCHAEMKSLMEQAFPVRIVGHMTDPRGARLASGLRCTEACHLAGQGDFLINAEGQLGRFQAAHVSNAEVLEMAKWCAARESGPSLVVEWPRPLTMELGITPEGYFS
jgi:S-DNA-T family DNA segregation ATPase FtsK/SpoIIIE